MSDNKVTILTGRLHLNRIPQELIRKDNDGNDYIYVDVVERFKPSEYGQTHSLTAWSPGTGKIYLADLKPKQLHVPGE